MVIFIKKIIYLYFTTRLLVKKAFLWSFISNYSSVVFQFISVVVLARILTPSEIGTFAIAAAIFAIGQMFRDLGISNYLIKETLLTKVKINAALFIAWFTCITLSIIFFVSSSFISSFYANPELLLIFKVLSLNLLFIPFGVVGQSMLRREMNFKKLALIEFLSQLTHISTAISLATFEFGAISLAYASFATTITTLIMVNILSNHKGKYRPSPKGLKEVLPFIAVVGTSNILVSLNRQGQPIIIGKILAETAVAFLDKGMAAIMLLNQLVMNAIQQVLVPLFSKLNRDNANVNDIYLTILSITTTVAWPFLFYLSYHAEFVVNLLFGSQWLNSVPLIPFLSIGAAINVIGRYFNELFVSTGYENISLKNNILVTIVRVIALISLSPYGLIFIVKGLIFVELARLISTTYFLKKYAFIRLSDMLIVLSKSTLILSFTILPLIPVIFFDIELNNLLNVSLHSLIVVIFWLAALKLTKHDISKEIDKLRPEKLNKS